MRRDSLLDFFEDYARQNATFLVHDDGYRTREVTYQEVAGAARACAARLTAAGIIADDKVVIWSENRIEWIVALWGCLIARAVLVPVDYRASPDLLRRITAIVNAKLVLIGEEVEVPKDLPSPVQKLTTAAGVQARVPGTGGRAQGAADARVPGAGGRAQDGADAGVPGAGGRVQDAADAGVPGAGGRAQGAADAGVSGAGGRAQGAADEGVSGAGGRVQDGARDGLAQIIFTSGATADPKGVTITHRNILANIIPIEREIAKYRRYVWPFHPIRFLNLLPLSHMFGQSMAAFVPPMLGGTVVFSHGFSPVEILRQIKSRRISVLVCVPKVLDVLRDHVERVAPITAAPDPLAGKHWAWRWWRYRAVHRLFGWKFWCVVCGAAPLDPELEAFWRKLGFLVVQGYGLTETAPIVTLNHPFRASRGTVGTPIGGVEVKIAPDGEILVRGENVTSGYYVPEGGARMGDAAREVAAAQASAFENGWFHTGDIGELDSKGRLLIKGRKKEMIVTPQGLNVFPEDVERSLLAQPGLKDAAVVGLAVSGEERIHAVLVLEPDADVDAIVSGANARLEDHQRVWSTSIWPGTSLPRTEGTQKLKRRDLQRWAAGAQSGTAAPIDKNASVAAIVGRYAAGRPITPNTTLDALGLSSLDRVELMMALEETFQTTLDESALAGAKTITEIESLVGAGSPSPGETAAGTRDAARTPQRPTPAERPIAFPSWNRSWPAWFLRRISLPTWILPLGRVFMKMRVEGLEHLRAIEGPVIFAANHQSHMDGPAILIALPARWRYRVAPAMAKEFFKAHFNPKDYSRKAWFTNSLNYYLSAEFFNAFPLPQREAGTRQTLRYIGEVLADRYSILIFPEGKRTQDGTLNRFMPGVGMIASRLGVPVVPVRLEGLDRVLHTKMKFPKRGPVRIAFGPALHLEGEDYAGLAAQVERAVKAL